MAIARSFLVALLVLVGVALAGAATVFLSDRALFTVAGYLVGTFTPYRLELEAPVLQRRAGHLEAAGVRLYQQGHDGPPLLAAQALKVGGLSAFLRRGDARETTISTASVQVYVDATDSAEDPDPADWLRHTRWLPKALELGVLHVITRSDDLRIVPLRNTKGHRDEAGTFALTSTATLPRKTLQLRCTLEEPAPDSLDLSAIITAPADESEVHLSGSLAARGGDLTYRFSLAGDYRRVETLLAILDDEAYGFAGRLRLRGELTGDLGSADLAVSELSLDNRPDYDFSGTGSLHWRRGEPVTTDLAARGTMADLGPFAALLGTDLSALGAVDAALELDGSLRRPRVRHFEFTSRSESGLALTIQPTGEALFLDEQLPTDIALKLRASGPTAAALDPWVRALPVETGPWVITGTARRRGETLAVDGLELTVDSVLGGRLRARGAVGHLASAGDTGARFTGLHLAVEASGLSLAALAASTEASLPVSLDGDLSLTATLEGEDDALAARAIDATIELAGGSTRVKGGVARLMALEGVDLEFTTRELNVAALGDDLLPASLGRLLAGGRVSGRYILRHDTDDWRLENLDLALEGAERVELAMTGTVQQLAGAPRAQLEARYRIRRPADDAGIGLPPGAGTAVLDLTAKRQLIGVHAFLGETDLTSIVEISRDETGITGLRAEVDAPRLHLPDLARMQAQQQLAAEERDQAGMQEKAQDDRPFTRVPAYPIDLRLDIGDITGSNTRLRNFVVGVRGADRRFTLGRFDVEYAGGAVQLRGVADFSGEEAAISVAGEALSVPVTALAADLGYGGEIEGTLSLRGGLTSQAASREALVANVDGSLAGAVADGYIEGAAFDILMTDLVSWLLLGGILQENTNFECGIAKFVFEDGVARSEGIYLATKHMIAQGKATLDFPRNELDVRIDPRARSRAVQIPSSVRIRGPMNNPAIIPSPIAATLDASAKLLFLIPELGMKLLGIKPGKGNRANPCAAMFGEEDGGGR
jgi:hypothetical protein